MVDRIAEIREAIEAPLFPRYPSDEQRRQITTLTNAARAYADLLDSDALIIRRDENGEWPDWATPYPPLVKVLDSLERRARLASSQGVEPTEPPFIGEQPHDYIVRAIEEHTELWADEIRRGEPSQGVET